MAKPKTTKPTPPAGLSQESTELWDWIVAHYDPDPAQRHLIRLALEASDRAAQAKSEIDRDGASFQDRYGQTRVNPLCAIERDSRAAVLTFFCKLGIQLPDAD